MCGAIEYTYHFIFECANYSEYRRSRNAKLVEFVNLTLNILIFGDKSLSFDQNAKIFDTVQSYISSINRF